MAHIALNAQLLAGPATYRSAGIHQYLANLLTHLPAADPALRYTVFVGEGRPTLPGADIQRTAWPTSRPPIRIAWEQVAQPLALWRAHPDLLHSMAFVSPLINPCPAVVTVYDLSFKLMPERFLPAQRLYLSAFTAHSCRRARRVLAISKSTQADVARVWGVAVDKIDVAPPGVDAAFRPLPRSEIEAFRAAKGLPEKFILYLGTLEPRKNLDVLLRAFSNLQSEIKNQKLILAGAKGWLYDELFQLVRELKLESAVLFPGYIPSAELPLWYNAASALAYPSAYEGFGMPVLEALACGVPVVTSNVSSLPEAGGEAAWQVSPQDANAVAGALRAALESGADRVAQGRAHAARFTWANTAAQTVGSYHRALA